MSDEDIQRIAQAVYDMMFNDLQQIKQEIEQTVYSAQNSIMNEVSSQARTTRSDISSIQGQLYNLRRV